VLRVLLEYSLPLTVTQPAVDPRGEPAVLFFGYRLGTGLPPWGPPPHPGPAVHSDGYTALHYAARNDNRRIVRLLVDADADVNARDRYGCAVCVCGESADECAGRVRAARRPCRATPLHKAARRGHSSCVAELLLRGADGAVRANDGYRCAAPHSRKPKTAAAARAQGHAEAIRGTLWEARGVPSGREGGALRPPPHSPRHPPPASRPIPPGAPCSDGYAVVARRSSGQRGNRPHSTL
jgi:hypothetical protein